MVRIFIVLCLIAFTACVPRSTRTDDERDALFSIQPEGLWKGLCIDDVPMTSQSGIRITGQKKTVEFLSNDRIKFTTDFISGSCGDTVHKVQLRHVSEGTITYQQSHRDLNGEVRLRKVSVKISREYYKAMTKAGLEFVQANRELGMNARVSDTIEVESGGWYFKEAEGFLAVKKNTRNLMNVLLDTSERISSFNDDVLERNLTTSNLYARNIIK